MAHFYLGTHMPSWLRHVEVPLFISHRTLRRYKTVPVSVTNWALDSGGFTEISMYGKWETTPNEYAEAIDRYAEETGMLDWASPQDWMCEPHMIQKTGLSIEAHQQLSVESVCTLRSLTKNRVIPVLQGWRVGDYLNHVSMYESAGFDLLNEPVVGVGSICRRQSTREAAEIARQLMPLRLHAFGAKQDALRLYGQRLFSCDSMAWSFGGRMNPDPLCPKKSCANCLHYALRWRDKLLRAGEQAMLYEQMELIA